MEMRKINGEGETKTFKFMIYSFTHIRLTQ